MSDPFIERYLRLGQAYDAEMMRASIQRCNCMVRYKDGPQLPARRDRKMFYDPEGSRIVAPDSFEDMHWSAIERLMSGNNEVYIGHMFEPMSVEAIVAHFKETK